MNRIWKKLCLKVLLGFGSGLAVGAFFMLAEMKTPETFMGAQGTEAVVLYMLYCGIYGAVAVGGHMIYEIDRFSLAKATVLHFLISFIGLCALGSQLGWLDFGSGEFWFIFVIFLAVYTCIWFTMTFAYKRRIRKLNDELEKWKSLQHLNEHEPKTKG